MSKTQSPALLDLEVDRQLSAPLYEQIVTQLRARVGSGALPGGTRLPPTRDLAARLGVTRNTIVNVYDQLVGEGIVEGSGRRGTFVSMLRGRAIAPQESVQNKPPALLDRGALAPPAAVGAPHLDWWPGQTLARSLPLTAWRNACRKAGRSLPPVDYGDAQGDLGLRRAIALWLTKNRCVNVGAGQIIVTRGTGDFLKFLADALVRAGDLCAIEDPGHLAVRRALSAGGARVAHVPVDAEGMDVAQAFQGETPPALVHATPSHQYPLGARLSLKRRRELVDAAQRHGTLILENEYGCEFVYEGSDFPTLYSMAPANTILLGTFANTATPAMRLGFAVAPESAVPGIIHLIAQSNAQASWAGQKIMEELILSGDLDRHVRRSQRHYDAMRRLIRDRLAPYHQLVSVQGDIGGLHVVLCGADAEIDAALQRALTQQAVRFQSVASLTTRAPSRIGVLLGYSHMELPALRAALDLVERCIQAIAA